MLLQRSLLHEEVRSQMESFQCVCGDASVKYGLNESDCWPSLQFDWVVEAFCAQLPPKLFFFPFHSIQLSVPLFQILQALDSLFSFKWLQEIATAILQDTCLVQLSHWHNKLVPPFQSTGLRGQWRPAPQIHQKNEHFVPQSAMTRQFHTMERFFSQMAAAGANAVSVRLQRRWRRIDWSSDTSSACLSACGSLLRRLSISLHAWRPSPAVNKHPNNITPPCRHTHTHSHTHTRPAMPARRTFSFCSVWCMPSLPPYYYLWL